MVVYQYPFKKYILGTRYGIKGDSWSCGYHSGLDIKSTNYGGDGIVYPVATGVVESIGAHGKSYGNHFCIKHPDGIVSLSAHLKSINVTEGQKVTLTTKLGQEGTTGNSSGLHLHLEIHKDKYSYPAKIDPKKWLDEHIAAQNKIQTEEEEEMRYNKLSEIPTYAQPTIKKLMDKGIVKGDAKGNLDLSLDMIRLLVWNDRVGLYK